MARRDAMPVTIDKASTYVARRAVIDLIAEHSASDLANAFEQLDALREQQRGRVIGEATYVELERVLEITERASVSLRALMATREPEEAIEGHVGRRSS